MGVGGQHHALAALPPGRTRYPLYRRLGRPQGRSGRRRKISPLPVFDPRTVQPVASRYTDWAIPAHNVWFVNGENCLSLKLCTQKLVLCFALRNNFQKSSTRIAVGPPCLPRPALQTNTLPYDQGQTPHSSHAGRPIPLKKTMFREDRLKFWS